MKNTILTLIFSLMFAASAFAVEVSVPDVKARPGSLLTVPVTADDATGVVAFEFELHYDPAIAVPEGTNFGCSLENTLAANMWAFCNVSPEGTLRVSAFGIYPLEGGGTVLNIAFRAASLRGVNVSDLAFANGSFYQWDGTNTAVFTDGSITVNPKKLIDPRLK